MKRPLGGDKPPFTTWTDVNPETKPFFSRTVTSKGGNAGPVSVAGRDSDYLTDCFTAFLTHVVLKVWTVEYCLALTHRSCYFMGIHKITWTKKKQNKKKPLRVCQEQGPGVKTTLVGRDLHRALLWLCFNQGYLHSRWSQTRQIGEIEVVQFRFRSNLKFSFAKEWSDSCHTLAPWTVSTSGEKPRSVSISLMYQTSLKKKQKKTPLPLHDLSVCMYKRVRIQTHVINYSRHGVEMTQNAAFQFFIYGGF